MAINRELIKKDSEVKPFISSQDDLKKYGIDYSPEQRNEIASIFANSATKAYNTAQNQYANQMAAERSSLADTIRRSQSQAIATGATRGMQAANELSSMLGLQEKAAQGATELQGSYAEALAQAQQKAMDLQNIRAQTGANIASADIAGDAQKYSVNMDAFTNAYQAEMNDPYRILKEVANLRNAGDNRTADMLLQGWLASSGFSVKDQKEYNKAKDKEDKKKKKK